MRQDYPDPAEMNVFGFDVMVDDAIGHLWVYHDGSITWDQLQAIKTRVWGEDTRAIEAYPARAEVVNTRNCRHLWRLGADDFCPDLLGHVQPKQTLERRYFRAWEGA